jgi:hypothetical protein
LHQRQRAFRGIRYVVDTGIVRRVEADQYVLIDSPRHRSQRSVEKFGTQLRRAAARFHMFRQPNGHMYELY